MANTTTEDENHTRWEEFEPYRTYLAGAGDESWRGKAYGEALRGVSGDVLNMDADLARGLAERRKARSLHGRGKKSDEKEEDGEEGKGEVNAEGHDGMGENSLDEGAAHRRLQAQAVGDLDEDRKNEGIREDGDGGHDRYLDRRCTA